MTQVNDVRDAHVETTPARAVSPWQPLSQPVFRMLWIATVVSNVGSWMSDVGINWSMLTLSADPLDIALVQAASSLPMFLFALPSGVMADIVDRRKYLLFSQLWVFIAAAGLTVLSFTGHVTPTVLLVATFLLSVGAAMYQYHRCRYRAAMDACRDSAHTGCYSYRYQGHHRHHRR